MIRRISVIGKRDRLRRNQILFDRLVHLGEQRAFTADGDFEALKGASILLCDQSRDLQHLVLRAFNRCKEHRPGAIGALQRRWRSECPVRIDRGDAVLGGQGGTQGHPGGGGVGFVDRARGGGDQDNVGR